MSERYEELGPLGRGAFGRVARVHDRDSGRCLALKRPHPDCAEAEARLRAEHAALSAVRHPGVVAPGELGRDDRGVFFTMELAEGPDLVSWVRGDVAREPAAAVRRNLPMAFGQDLQEEGTSRWRACTSEGFARIRAALWPLAGAVQVIHDSGRLHLDLVPSHVRVRADGQPVVLDLGLALRTDEDGRALRSPDVLVGSAPYMAPEHGEGAPTRASDWYSVGVMLFEALTGALPFEGGGPDVLARKRSLSAPAPSELVGELPEDLERACTALLARAPAERGDGRVLRALLEPTLSAGT